MEKKIELTSHGDMRFGPYKTHLTLSCALNLMCLPVVVVVGDHRWIIADSHQKHIEALCRLWRLSDEEKGKHQSAWVEPIPKDTVDRIYERNRNTRYKDKED